MLSVTITSLSATTSLPLRLQSQRLACMCVGAHMWLSKGSIHAMSGLARCCRVTLDLFSSWLLLLEVCRAHKSHRLILLTHSKKGGLWLQCMLQPNVNNFQSLLSSLLQSLLAFFFYIVRKVNYSFLVTRGASERKNYVVGLSATPNYLLSSEVVAVNIIWLYNALVGFSHRSLCGSGTLHSELVLLQ